MKTYTILLCILVLCISNFIDCINQSHPYSSRYADVVLIFGPYNSNNQSNINYIPDILKKDTSYLLNYGVYQKIYIDSFKITTLQYINSTTTQTIDSFVVHPDTLKNNPMPYTFRTAGKTGPYIISIDVFIRDKIEKKVNSYGTIIK